MENFALANRDTVHTNKSSLTASSRLHHHVISSRPAPVNKRNIKIFAHQNTAKYLHDILHVAALESLTNPSDILLPTAFASAVGFLTIKFIAYSQLELLRTTFLSRYVRPNGAKVLQIGGSTRDLYYYPRGTVQVTAGGKNITPGLWEQAGIQARIPVRAIQADTRQCLASQAGSSFDSVVFIDQLIHDDDGKLLIQEAWRILKPQGTFIFVQQIPGNTIASLIRLGNSANNSNNDIVEVITSSHAWDVCQWEIAAEGLDPHVIGMASKPAMETINGEFSSVDTQAFEQVMKTKKAKKSGDGGASGRRKGFSTE